MFGLIAGLAGSALGFLGQKSANKQKARAHAEDSYNNSPQGIRANAEEAGFNPLTVLNSGRSFGAGYAPQFGNALGHLGQGLVDAATGYEQVQIQKAELDMERERLDALMRATTLGPDIPGIYGGRYGAGSSNSTNQRGDQVHREGGNSILRSVIGGNDSDPAYKGGALNVAGPVGSDRLEAGSPDKTLQPLSFMGMTFRGTGTTSSAQIVEDNAGDLAGSFWAPVAAVDYAARTYLENLGRPFAKYVYEPVSDWFGRPLPKRNPKTPKTKQERIDFMRSYYPTAYD